MSHSSVVKLTLIDCDGRCDLSHVGSRSVILRGAPPMYAVGDTAVIEIIVDGHVTDTAVKLGKMQVLYNCDGAFQGLELFYERAVPPS